MPRASGGIIPMILELVLGCSRMCRVSFHATLTTRIWMVASFADTDGTEDVRTRNAKGRNTNRNQVDILEHGLTAPVEKSKLHSEGWRTLT